jgi:hypothetical protein
MIKTQMVMEESAKLKIGLKNTNSFPPKKATN